MKVSKVLAPVVLLLILAGCATSVGRVARDPQAYNGKTIKIRGEAGRGFSIPLTDITVFILHGEDTSVPVAAFSKPREGQTYSIRGTVWAFPQDGMEAETTEAVQAVEDFLIEKDLVERKKARDASALVLTAVRKLSQGLGNIWFLIEE